MSVIHLFGRGAFAAAAADALARDGHTIAAVISPATHPRTGRADRARLWAARAGVRWVDAAAYRHDALGRADLNMAAHSHNVIGRRTRRLASASVGYHPSLLPLHRGRDAVRWTIRDGDRVTGGTVYHLTDAIDAGPIAAQDYALVPSRATASSLWRDLLFPLGVHLLRRVAADADAGRIGYTPQDESLATWEPSWDRAPLHRPELLELPTREAAAGLAWGPAAVGWRAER